MKQQIGVRVDTQAWQAFRLVCSQEKLRPSEPVEDFLKLVSDNGSALGLLRLMREAMKSQVDGYEAYARVLLDWYTHGKFWVKSEPEDVAVETLLLDVLKTVADSDLRRGIEEALISRQRGIDGEKKAKEAENEGTP